ncbi:MAG: hypothetical protein AAFR84_06560 [Pseudomonadota bacterium]
MQMPKDITPEDQDRIGRAAAPRVNAAEIARLWGIERSTVSRYLARHPKLKDGEELISPEEWARHRAENRATEDARDALEDRKRLAEAEIAEIKLGELRGELKRVADVKAVVVEAVADLLQGLEAGLEPALREAGVERIGPAVDAVLNVLHEQRGRVAEHMKRLGG